MISGQKIKEIETYLQQIYKPDDYRYKHINNVKKVAISLAEIYNVDLSDVIVASLLHDATKSLGDEENERLAKAYYRDLDYQTIPKACLHAYTAMQLATTKFAIDNQDILNAIKYHCSGRKAMSMLEKIIFVSDFIEESRDFVSEELRELAQQDIDHAVLQVMLQTKKYILAQGKQFSPLTEAAIKYYQMKTEVFNG